MQRNKSKNKLEQIEKVSQNPEMINENITGLLEKFQLKSKFSKFDCLKRCGVLLSSIVITLVLLPFLGKTTISGLYNSSMSKIASGKKDASYEAKKNDKINWRWLLLAMAKRFKFLMGKDNKDIVDIKGNAQKHTAIIFDDTTIEKTGRFIEGIGYVYDHIIHSHILGYKILVCAYWDGSSVIPIDFSIHREKRDGKLKKLLEKIKRLKDKILNIELTIKKLKDTIRQAKKEFNDANTQYQNKQGKTNKHKMERKQRVLDRKQAKLKEQRNKLKSLKIEKSSVETKYEDLKAVIGNCGLKQKDFKNQYNKRRQRNSCGHKRIKEADKNKIETSVSMLKRAVKNGFRPEYVITDTWFFCRTILQAVIDTGRSTELVSMAKIGNAQYKILKDGKFFNPHQIIALYERENKKESRKYKAKYIPLQAEYQGIRVKIFLVKFGTHATWRLLVTTDTKMSFIKLMDVYKIRWTIEVFFKECKQYLLLGKCQSQDFDAQIADATLSMIRYILLSYYKRTHYEMTIGGIFRKLSQAAIEENLLADIREYFFELLKIFAEFVSVDFFELYQELIRKKEVAHLIEKIGLNFEKKVA